MARRQLLVQIGIGNLARLELLAQLVAQALQHGDIAQQGLQLLLVGLDAFVGIGELGIDLGLGGGRCGCCGRGRGLGLGQRRGERVAIRRRGGELSRQGVTRGRRGGELRLQLVPRRRGLRELLGELGQRAAQIRIGRLLQREHVAEAGELLAELGQLALPAGEHLAQEELADDEDHQGEDDDHQQGAEDIDITGPDVEMPAGPVAAAHRH